MPIFFRVERLEREQIAETMARSAGDKAVTFDTFMSFDEVIKKFLEFA